VGHGKDKLGEIGRGIDNRLGDRTQARPPGAGHPQYLVDKIIQMIPAFEDFREVSRCGYRSVCHMASITVPRKAATV
jgi:hypothetical protein